VNAFLTRLSLLTPVERRERMKVSLVLGKPSEGGWHATTRMPAVGPASFPIMAIG
jgi:hypothetical protein